MVVFPNGQVFGRENQKKMVRSLQRSKICRINLQIHACLFLLRCYSNTHHSGSQKKRKATGGVGVLEVRGSALSVCARLHRLKYLFAPCLRQVCGVHRRVSARSPDRPARSLRSLSYTRVKVLYTYLTHKDLYRGKRTGEEVATGSSRMSWAAVHAPYIRQHAHDQRIAKGSLPHAMRTVYSSEMHKMCVD